MITSKVVQRPVGAKRDFSLKTAPVTKVVFIFEMLKGE